MASDATALHARSYDWPMLQAVPLSLTGDKADPHPILAEETCELFKLAVAQFMPPAPNEAITMLAFGTLVMTTDGQTLPPFAGFVSHPQHAGRPWRLPAHRFHEGEVEAKRNLHFSQIHYERFAEGHPLRRHTDTALAIVAGIGYLRAGWDKADADVVALWRHCTADAAGKREWCALVRCVGFGRANVCVLVPFRLCADQPPTSETMHAVASAGRASFRYDILTTRIVGTVTTPTHVAMPTSSSANSSPVGSPAPPPAGVSSSEEANTNS
jgi:hypothetical protein